MLTLKMKKEFKEILEREQALDKYIANLKYALNESREELKIQRIEHLNDKENFESFISTSFGWANTPEGHQYWWNISEKTL